MAIEIKIAINPVIEQMARDDRLIRSALRGGIVEAFTDWHQNVLPGHFAPGAAQKYGYSKRSQGYLARKGGPKVAGRYAKFGAFDNYRPLQWSGALRSSVLGSFSSRDQSGANKLNVVFTLPATPVINFWTANRVTKNGLRHDLAAELSAMTPAEQARFTRIVEEYVINFIQSQLSEGERFMLSQSQRAA